MTLIARLFVRGAAAAGTLGAAAMLALAPQPGVANTLAFDDHSVSSPVRAAEPAPSAACVAAKNALVTAWKADLTEDASERNLARSGADTSTDPAEDKAEFASFKTLRGALISACAPQETAEQSKNTTTTTTTITSPACTAAKTALKQFFTQLATTEKADWTNGTEGSSSDQTADQAAWAQAKTLFQAAATACGFTPGSTTDAR